MRLVKGQKRFTPLVSIENYEKEDTAGICGEDGVHCLKCQRCPNKTNRMTLILFAEYQGVNRCYVMPRVLTQIHSRVVQLFWDGVCSKDRKDKHSQYIEKMVQQV